jgi:putative radical SAM enzyme (TIGR03279 family)
MRGPFLFEVKGVRGPAAQTGLRAGDKIISVNGEPLIDYIDYVWFCGKTWLKFRVRRGEETLTLRMAKEENEDLGLEFTEPLLGRKRVCGNRCVFCFVDQLPRGMRKSLYVKDEDWRWSLLSGSYVTLTDIGRDELRRILRRGAGPLYVSVHTVDEALRRRMTGNEAALRIRPLLRRLARRGIRFHAQAVVCPGLNDGERLKETFRFLKALYPAAQSLAVVPVGLTAHRQGLAAIPPVSAQMAMRTVKEVEKWQKECLNSMGTRFVFAADEYYLRAGAPVPDAASYEDYPQIENGVGLIAKLLYEADGALEGCRRVKRHVSVVTGVDAYPVILGLAARAAAACGARIDVYRAENETFGKSVTVSGLLCGADIAAAVAGKPLGEALIVPASAVNEGVFLDDMTLEQMSEALGVPVHAAGDMAQLLERIQKR